MQYQKGKKYERSAQADGVYVKLVNLCNVLVAQREYSYFLVNERLGP